MNAALAIPLLRPIVLPLIHLRAIARMMRLFLHLAWGSATIASLFPFIGVAMRRRLKQRWSVQLLQILGVKLRHQGTAPLGLIVANHVSFLDIYAINAVSPAAFVAKDEVHNWPVIGWLSRHTETIFLERGSRSAAQRTREHLVDKLKEDTLVALFPEGTTSDGSQVLPFHGALLQSAIDAQVPVTPIALRYLDRRGNPTQAAAYAGDTTLVGCLWSIACSDGLIASVDVLPIMTTANGDRRHLSAHAHHQISKNLFPHAHSLEQKAAA
ncbi:MAG TPA: lysophospholipid acyltransferase family protein [Rhodocyclaceae bacterium]|nr:lysophospholipid acyltransferase family protein [Rhodocyclaceae bacterium]